MAGNGVSVDWRHLNAPHHMKPGCFHDHVFQTGLLVPAGAHFLLIGLAQHLQHFGLDVPKSKRLGSKIRGWKWNETKNALLVEHWRTLPITHMHPHALRCLSFIQFEAVPSLDRCEAWETSTCPDSLFAIQIIPARDPKQCCGVFLLEIVDAKSVSGSVHQNPVALLLQDVFVRISASAASRATCARSLYEDLLCKMSESGRLYEEPLGPLVQELCMRISCACAWFLHLCKIGVWGSLSRSPRILKEHLCKISVCGSLVQDLSVMMSASGSCRTSCARSL